MAVDWASYIKKMNEILLLIRYLIYNKHKILPPVVSAFEAFRPVTLQLDTFI